MRVRIALALACGLVAATLTPSVAASAAPVRSAGGGLVPGAGVVTLSSRTTAPDRATNGAAAQAAASSTFCYVMVYQPQINAALILTATWQLDCRNGTTPGGHATDIDMTNLTVRIYQGTPALGGTNVAGRQCFNHHIWNAGCSASTLSPIQYYSPYYSKLEVTVTLLDGSSFSGVFYTGTTTLT